MSHPPSSEHTVVSGRKHAHRRRLSPEAREAAKTKEQQAEDIAYTINHTITCLSLDIGIPFVNHYGRLWLHKKAPGLAANAGDKPSMVSNLKDWWTGEIIGDLGAVPVTIMAQRLAPGFMHSLEHSLSKVLGPLYRRGAERSTAAWASENGITVGSPEYNEHRETLYHNEVSHLPQAAIWTVAAFGLNVAAQKYICKSNDSALGIIGGKMFGAALATTTVLGSRALAPETAHRWDRYTSTHVFLPMTKGVGRLFGIDRETVDRMEQKKNGQGSWRERIRQEDVAQAKQDRADAPAIR